jgi:hypothetical protein
MDEREIRALVRGWYERSKRGDPVSRFVFLWFCFNAWLSYESDDDKDRQMIEWLKTAGPDSRLKASYVRALASDVFRRDLQALVANSPIRGTRRENPAVVQIASIEDFAGILDGVYQVRCNLFHGAKRADDSRDQKLVIASAAILRKWVGNLVAGWT